MKDVLPLSPLIMPRQASNTYPIILFFVFGDKVSLFFKFRLPLNSLCTPGWPRTHGDSPVSAPRCWDYRWAPPCPAYHHTTSLPFYWLDLGSSICQFSSHFVKTLMKEDLQNCFSKWYEWWDMCLKWGVVFWGWLMVMYLLLKYFKHSKTHFNFWSILVLVSGVF